MNEASYDNQLSNLKAHLIHQYDGRPEALLDPYARLLLATSSDEVDITNLAKQVLDPEWIYGDSDTRVTTTEIVEKLVDDIKSLRGPSRVCDSPEQTAMAFIHECTCR